MSVIDGGVVSVGIVGAVWAPFGHRHKKGRFPDERISAFLIVFDNKIKYLDWCPEEDLNRT